MPPVDEVLEGVALARACLPGDHKVLAAAQEVEARELEDERVVEAGLECPLEGLEGLALGQTAGVDPAFDALLELVRSLGAE